MRQDVILKTSIYHNIEIIVTGNQTKKEIKGNKIERKEKIEYHCLQMTYDTAHGKS